MKVLIPGGSGFIGTWTCRELEAQGHEPVVFDRHMRPGLFDEATGDFSFILGDVRDATAVTEAVAHVDAVIHLAGVLGTAETVANPRPAAETNILGALNALEACAHYGVPLVNIAVGNWFEFSPYSVTKHCAERFCEVYRRHRGVRVAVVRALNAYGPGQALPHPWGHSRVRKVIPSFCARALSGEPVEVYGDGRQVMDMVHARDVARVLVAALGYDGDQILEAGTGRPTTVTDIAEMVCTEVQAQAGIAAHIRRLPMRPGETPGAVVLADPASLAPLGLGPQDMTRLEDGIRETVAHYRKVLAGG